MPAKISVRAAGAAILLLFGSAIAAPRAPRADRVAPGVWRLRFGRPERNTPLRFRSAPVRADALSVLPACELPFDPREFAFSANQRGCSVRVPMADGEHLYGFGLSPSLFDMTGRRAFIRPTDKPENPLNDSHAPVPFYVSTRGYGVYVDTARYASFYTGNVAPLDDSSADNSGGPALTTEELYRPRSRAHKSVLVDIPAAGGVDVYVFGGPAMGDAVRRYNLFSGGGCVPPLWGLGMYYRGLGAFTADESAALAESFRTGGIPCDVWGLEPGWQTKTYSSSFVWNTNGFPDPDAFIAKMRGMGYELSVWQHSFTHPTSPIFSALKPYSGDYMVWGGLVPDFATPDARRVFQAHQDDILFSKGVRAVKLDECDNQPADPHPWSFPEASSFPSGLDGEQMHSLFGVLYQQTMLEPMRRRNVRGWNLVRNSHALAAPLPFVLYSDTYDHRGYIRALANEGFSGLLWGPEVRDTSSVEDLYRRVETVIFSPLAQMDSWYMRLPPWEQMNREKSNRGERMPEHVQVTAAVRRLFELRMSLVPYLYSAFNEYRLTGTPPLRALVMEWPSDPATYGVDDEFMFGPSLLVAPMVSGEASRKVYLPAGDWYDFWTHEKVPGGRTVEVAKPLDQIPVFVRGGSLLPIARPVQRFTPETTYELTVHVYGERPAPFTLYEDDGETLAFERGVQNRITLTWDGTVGAAAKSGAYTGTPRYRVVGWVRH